MTAWLTQLLGEQAATYTLYFLGALAVLILLWVAWFWTRRVAGGVFVEGGRNRRPRLGIVDATAVDNQRRIVLVRRDDVEHLVMIGGENDLVIETNIAKVPAEAGQPLSAKEQRRAREAAQSARRQPPREAPARETAHRPAPPATPPQPRREAPPANPPKMTPAAVLASTPAYQRREPTLATARAPQPPAPRPEPAAESSAPRETVQPTFRPPETAASLATFRKQEEPEPVEAPAPQTSAAPEPFEPPEPPQQVAAATMRPAMEQEPVMPSPEPEKPADTPATTPETTAEDLTPAESEAVPVVPPLSVLTSLDEVESDAPADETDENAPMIASVETGNDEPEAVESPEPAPEPEAPIVFPQRFALSADVERSEEPPVETVSESAPEPEPVAAEETEEPVQASDDEAEKAEGAEKEEDSSPSPSNESLEDEMHRLLAQLTRRS
ncbi:hypothetical protein [Oricola indica]|uniref:hypothetical protein n=1 Tax=Oricola indica TaxID=2872591 RepID=UPI003CCC34A2